ncbi:MAG: lycopene cyclase domain-containing protein [Crocinitomix sp.]|nr:lycopene cyclase domain-containing protein [Crocinitomix sp.]
MKTYLLLDGLTILFPLLLSFDKKVAFYKSWKYLIFGFLLVGIPFIIWDVIFTKMEVWGFNPDYLTGINLYNLPIEEILFFVAVPFACTFIYACVKEYLPKLRLTGFNRVFYALLVIYAIAVMIFGFGGYYSTIAGLLAILTIIMLRKLKVKLRFLPISFLIALVPFFIVNGILTGSGLDDPIVWYDNAENTGIRFFTIPMDDVVYAWTLLAGNIAAYQYFMDKASKKKPKWKKRKKVK